jgi:RNA polymerase sigma factor (sigma-70 family)
MPHPDHKYIEALLHNESSLIEGIYKNYADKIKWMVLNNSGNETDAADLFQDALIDLHRKAQRGFELTCPLGGFLYLMCKNRWINELQKRKRSPVTFKDADGFNITDQTESNISLLQKTDEQRLLVSQMLQEIGENCRELLLLSWSGKPMQEVAQLLNITYAYVRKRKSECMAKLITKVRQSPKFEFLKSSE